MSGVLFHSDLMLVGLWIRLHNYLKQEDCPHVPLDASGLELFTALDVSMAAPSFPINPAQGHIGKDGSDINTKFGNTYNLLVPSGGLKPFKTISQLGLSLPTQPPNISRPPKPLTSVPSVTPSKPLQYS